MKAMGYASKDAPTGGAPMIFVGSFILSAIIAFTLAFFLGPGGTASMGAAAGFMAGAFWVATALQTR